MLFHTCWCCFAYLYLFTNKNHHLTHELLTFLLLLLLKSMMVESIRYVHHKKGNWVSFLFSYIQFSFVQCFFGIYITKPTYCMKKYAENINTTYMYGFPGFYTFKKKEFEMIMYKYESWCKHLLMQTFETRV